jgi:type III secretion protein V
MAIDNDARAGVISSDEARRKRDDLRRESQLYGSMDGAMRFVQGDAIAGFFVIAANILGGVGMGLSSGLAFQDAVQTYTMLTVGDGLVTQIPSLLTSICAGIIVTRVSSTESATLSADLRSQLFAQPVVLVATALILVVFAVLPGIPAWPFALVAGTVLGAAALLVRKRQQGAGVSLHADEFGGLPGLPTSEARRLDGDAPEAGLVLALDQGVLFRIFRASPQRFIGSWKSFRDGFFQDVGVLLPEVQVIADGLLGPSSFRVSISGVEMLRGSVPLDALLVEMSSAQAPLVGLRVLQQEEHPLSGHRVFWTPSSGPSRKMLEAAGIRTLDFFDFIVARIAQFCLSHPDEFLSVTDVHSQLRQIDKRYPGLIAEGFGREFISAPKLTEVLQELVRQGVSVRDFRGIIEIIASYCAVHSLTLDNENTVDLDDVIRYVRSARKRQILRRIVGGGRALRVVSLSTAVEDALREADYDNRALPLAVDVSVFEALKLGLDRVMRPALELGVTPVALLCSQDLRLKVQSLLRSTARRMFVASYEELEPGIPVEQVGTWELEYR